MLIKREPDIYEKLRHLAGMATDDVLDEVPTSKAATAKDTTGLIGADTVVPGKVVINGAQSLGLAKRCSDRALGLFVECDSLKLLAQAPAGTMGLPPWMERVRCGTWHLW